MKSFLRSLFRSSKDASGPASSTQVAASKSRGEQPFARAHRRLEPGAVQRVFRSLMDEHIHSTDPLDQDRLFLQIERESRRRRRGALPDFSTGRAAFSRRLAWGAAPLVVAALSLTAWLVVPEKNDTLSYSVSGRGAANDLVLSPSRAGLSPHGGPAAGEMRRWASGNEQLVLSFSDQSEVRLEPRTTLDVRVLPSNRALFNLAEGKVLVNVHHQDQTDYRFQAGSYEVLVTGTTFELGFEPKAEHVALHMREGRVEVHSPNGDVLAVRGGESFERSLPAPVPVAEVEPPGESEKPSHAAGVGVERRAPAPGGLDTRRGAPPAESRALSSGRGDASYAALARDGKFSEIVQDAMGRGLNNVLSSKPPSELIQLSHAARYVGHNDVARPVLQALVRRYGATSEGRAAVFFLGRISDGAGDGAAAAQQYEQYLRLDPRGAYAPEALGRRMILAQRNSPQLAVKLAQEYLARFPQGSYKTHAAALVRAAGPLERGSR